MKKTIQQGERFIATIQTENSDAILYFLTNSQGEATYSETLELKADEISFDITSNNLEMLKMGVNNIKIFAISDSVSKPDFYESSFIVTEEEDRVAIRHIQKYQIFRKYTRAVDLDNSNNRSHYWPWHI